MRRTGIMSAPALVLAACTPTAWYPLTEDPRAALLVERTSTGVQIRTIDTQPIVLEESDREVHVLTYAEPLDALNLDRVDDRVSTVEPRAADARRLPEPTHWLTVLPGALPEESALSGFDAAFADLRVQDAACGKLRIDATLTLPSVNIAQVLVWAGDDVVFTEYHTATGTIGWPTLVRATPDGFAPVPEVHTSSRARELFALRLPDGNVGVLSGERRTLHYVELDPSGRVVHAATGPTVTKVARWTAAEVRGEIIVVLTDDTGAVWRINRDTGALIPIRGPHVDTRCEDEPDVQPLFLHDTGRLVYGRSGAPVAAGSIFDGLVSLSALIDGEPHIACRGVYAGGSEGREAVWIEEPRVGLGSPPSLVWWRTPVAPGWFATPTVGGPSLQIAFASGWLAVPVVESVELWAHTAGTAQPRLCDRISLGGTTKKAIEAGPRNFVAGTGREGGAGDYREVVLSWLRVE